VVAEDADEMKNEARQELLKVAHARLEQLEDGDLKNLLTDSFVEKVFDLAWRCQFDSDRSEPQRALRSLVEGAVAGLVKRDAD